MRHIGIAFLTGDGSLCAVAGMVTLQNLQNLANLQNLPQVASLAAGLQGMTAGLTNNQLINTPLNLTVSSSGRSPNRTWNRVRTIASAQLGAISRWIEKEAARVIESGDIVDSSLAGGTVPTASSTTAAPHLLPPSSAPMATLPQLLSQPQPVAMPQFILTSGQLVQGIQGAQLLIPTSQGKSPSVVESPRCPTNAQRRDSPLAAHVLPS